MMSILKALSYLFVLFAPNFVALGVEPRVVSGKDSQQIPPKQIISRIEKGGKTFEFIKTSPENWEVTEVGGDRICLFSTKYYGRSPGVDHPKLLDVFRQNDEIALIFFDKDRRFYFLRMWKTLPALKKGEVHFDFQLLSEGCWQTRDSVNIIDFYPTEKIGHPEESKAASITLTSLDTIKIVPAATLAEGWQEEKKADIFTFDITNDQTFMLKNGTRMTEVTRCHTIGNGEDFARVLLDSRTPDVSVREMVLGTSGDRQTYIAKLATVVSKETLGMVKERIDRAFATE